MEKIIAKMDGTKKIIVTHESDTCKVSSEIGASAKMTKHHISPKYVLHLTLDMFGGHFTGVTDIVYTEDYTNDEERHYIQLYYDRILLFRKDITNETVYMSEVAGKHNRFLVEFK